LVTDLEKAARAADRPRPRVALWVCAAVGPGSGRGAEQLRRGLVGYLAAPGYAEMFGRAGFGDVVAYARSGPHPRDLLAATPTELVDVVGLVGASAASVEPRMAAYLDAGVDDLVIVPAATDADPAGVATLTELAPLMS
jgi:hypothetical protein